MHRLKPSLLASLLMGFYRLFGLICWSFRLRCKNLTARGVNVNFFGGFRSGLRNINRPEAPSLCCLQFRATDAAAWHLGQRDPLGSSFRDLTGVFCFISVACYARA